MDADRVHQHRAILNADIGELEILQRRDAFVARHGILILNSAAQNVDAQKSARRAGDIKIVRHDVFDECAAPGRGS